MVSKLWCTMGERKRKSQNGSCPVHRGMSEECTGMGDMFATQAMVTSGPELPSGPMSAFTILMQP